MTMMQVRRTRISDRIRKLHEPIPNMDKVDPGRMHEEEARYHFQQLINAVDYCHSRGIYHRDLKPKNLLLDASGNLKVTDFVSSALAQQVGADGLLHTKCGTKNYVAPEV